jgi:Flp pilus assembly protein TadG
MTRPSLPLRRGQRGVAAIELAVILSGSLLLLPALVLFGRLFYQYSVMKSACRDAALYMASLPPAAVHDGTERNRAAGVAIRLVADAAEGAGITRSSVVTTAAVGCDGGSCGSSIPGSFRITTTYTFDGLGTGLLPNWTSDRGEWFVQVNSSAAYATASTYTTYSESGVP